MAPTIDYYFTLISPFTYLGHQALLDVARKHSADIVYRPLNLPDVYKTSGVLPIPERPLSRQNYRLIELQRVADFRDLKLNPKPAHFPTNPALANGAVVAIALQDGDPAGFVFSALKAVWSDDRDLSDPNVVGELVSHHGHDAASVLEAATREDVVAQIATNTQSAIDIGAVGVPAYVLNGEPFWGQDRIDYVDHALSTGRQPFTP